nr:ribosomal protein L22(archaeal)/L17eukaryotic/archaeal [uncultured archaeon]
MKKAGYSAQDLDTETTARAMARELLIPTKKTFELCRAIRGMNVEKAKEYLENVIALKQPVPFKTFNRWVGHKKGIGPGRYPVKSARAVLRLLESAQENAEYKGLTSDEMRIKVIAAHKGSPNKANMPRAHGTSTRWYHETVNIELVLEEVK